MHATKHLMFAAFVLGGASAAHGQGRSLNWGAYGGDAQRSNWERTDQRITKDNAKDLQLLFKMKLDTQPRTPRALMAPLILGNLISYRGFKELAFVASNSDIVYAIDVDLGKMFWTKHLEYASLEPPVYSSFSACPGGLTAMPVMPPPPIRGGPPRAPGGAVARGPAQPGAASITAPAPARGPFAVFGQPGVYAISSDGRLHRLNTSTGDDVVEPVKVLPSNANISSLNLEDNTIYAVTSHECNGAPDAVWAIDLTLDPPKAASYTLTGDGSGSGGVAVGANGTVYVQTSEKLLAFNAHDLTLKQSFDALGASSETSSPLVFELKDRELFASPGKGGDLYLVDSGTAQKTPIARNIDGLATWQDADGARWILASVSGPLRPEFKVSTQNGPAPDGSIVALKVEDQNGKAVLTPAWASRDISSPEPPVIANGVVFALSGGSHATLYALDGATGKELYSSRNLVTSPAAGTGMTVTNGRIYFGTTDGTFYAFGIYQEH